MAGDGWVMDIIFHSLVLVANELPKLWSAWSTEILLVLSFVMQFVLAILAGFRWRGVSNKVWDKVLRNVILFCYVGGDYVATAALGHLSVSSTSGEHQLLAFWAPFFLLHLGGPDNITAFQFEDNELSKRSVLQLVVLVSVASYVVYKSISGSWTMAIAAWLMLGVGVAKYTEKILALHRANLESIRRSVKKQRQHRNKGGRPYTKNKLRGGKDNEDTALNLAIAAHSLFYICKRAIVDSWVEMEPDEAKYSSTTLFQQNWENARKAMEMELSLMYDFLYTKAAVMYTWHGYSIRVYSPMAIGAAFLLVEFGNQDGRRQADVVITRVLLVATFLLEMASLVRALGSSWTAFQLYSTGRWSWLHHQVFCTSRWRLLGRAVAWLVRVEGHRRWSGRVGQLNLLQLSTLQQPSRVAKGNVGQDFERDKDRSMDTTVISQEKELREFLFRQTLNKLKDLVNLIKDIKEREEGVGLDTLKNEAKFRTKWGHQALKQRGFNTSLYRQLRWYLGYELQDGILTWHIATDIYLSMSDIARKTGDEAVTSVRAIRMLSDYMMFLLVERPHMLPGLVLRTSYELIYEDLAQIWFKHGTHDDRQSSASSICSRITDWKLFQAPVSSRLRKERQEKLARILHDMGEFESEVPLKSSLSNGTRLSNILLGVEEERESPKWHEQPESSEDQREELREWGMLKFLLDVWVDMFFFVSYQCSRESHARQLSGGGELTTIVWLMAEHIGMLAINTKAKVANRNYKRQ